MHRDRDAEWFSATELAEIARTAAVTDFPHTREGVNKWIKRLAREFPTSFGVDLASLSRPRRRQGGGVEYHCLLFDSPDTKKLYWQLCVIQDSRHLSDSNLGTAETLVGGGLPREFPEELDQHLVRRKVWRGRIHYHCETYWHPILGQMEGQFVLFTYSTAGLHLRRYDPWRQRLATRGAEGYLGLAEPEAKPDLPDWLQTFLLNGLRSPNWTPDQE